MKWDTPSYHPFIDGIFHETNQPATGISPINQWIGLRENLNLKAYSFYHYICGFPVIVPVNQSNVC